MTETKCRNRRQCSPQTALKTRKAALPRLEVQTTPSRYRTRRLIASDPRQPDCTKKRLLPFLENEGRDNKRHISNDAHNKSNKYRNCGVTVDKSVLLIATDPNPDAGTSISEKAYRTLGVVEGHIDYKNEKHDEDDYSKQWSNMYRPEGTKCDIGSDEASLIPNTSKRCKASMIVRPELPLSEFSRALLRADSQHYDREHQQLSNRVDEGIAVGVASRHDAKRRKIGGEQIEVQNQLFLGNRDVLSQVTVETLHSRSTESSSGIESAALETSEGFVTGDYVNSSLSQSYNPYDIHHDSINLKAAQLFPTEQVTDCVRIATIRVQYFFLPAKIISLLISFAFLHDCLLATFSCRKKEMTIYRNGLSFP
jgi:hypothetical protein